MCNDKHSRSYFAKKNISDCACLALMDVKLSQLDVQHDLHSSAEVVRVNMSYNTKGGARVFKELTRDQFAMADYFEDNLRCTQLTVKSAPQDAGDVILIPLLANMGLASTGMKISVAQNGSSARGSLDMAQRIYHQIIGISRVTLQLLPAPFAANCRNYDESGFESRADCLHRCADADGKVTQCAEKCAQPQCQTQLHTVDSLIKDIALPRDEKWRPLLFEMREPIMLIVTSPQITFQVFVIYIGDLLAMCFGFSMLGAAVPGRRRVRRLRWARRMRRRWAAWARGRDSRWRPVLARLWPAICWVACALQMSTILTSYLDYALTTVTQLNNIDDYALPNLTLCRALDDHQVERCPTDFRQAGSIWHRKLRAGMLTIVRRRNSTCPPQPPKHPYQSCWCLRAFKWRAHLSR